MTREDARFTSSLRQVALWWRRRRSGGARSGRVSRSRRESRSGVTRSLRSVGSDLCSRQEPAEERKSVVDLECTLHVSFCGPRTPCVQPLLLPTARWVLSRKIFTGHSLVRIRSPPDSSCTKQCCRSLSQLIPVTSALVSQNPARSHARKGTTCEMNSRETSTRDSPGRAQEPCIESDGSTSLHVGRAV